MTKQLFRFSIGTVAVTAILLSLGGCNSYKNIPYFQNLPDSGFVYHDGRTVPVTPFRELTIKPDDILSVTVQTMDPDMGNLMANVGSQNGLDAELSTPSSQSGTAAGQPVSGYLVDKEGNIELPVAGKVKVAGLTTAEAKEMVRKKAMTWYREPVVNVRIVNFKVTVLGEVQRPGAYIVSSERATVLDALGLAGDMTIYGTRTNVILSRREGEQQKMARFNLNQTDLYASPYFYLQQGDLLYVQPSKARAASMDGLALRNYGIITATLSLLLVAINTLR
ncbi:MAG: polysaccharide biosynthesis/export family protein [Edaphocola sp.]